MPCLPVLERGLDGRGAGLENEVCQPSVSNLPGYSKTLFGCPLAGRYVTVLATNAATTLDLCLVTVFLQGVPPSPPCCGPARPAPSYHTCSLCKWIP